MSDNIRLSDGTEGKPEDLAAFFNMTGTSPIGAKVVSVHPLWIICKSPLARMAVPI